MSGNERWNKGAISVFVDGLPAVDALTGWLVFHGDGGDIADDNSGVAVTCR